MKPGKAVKEVAMKPGKAVKAMKPRKAEAVEVVASMAALRKFVLLHGSRNEVEVEVAGTIRRLCDIIPIRNTLVQKTRRQIWGVRSLHRLTPLVPLAEHVRTAETLLNDLVGATSPTHLRFDVIEKQGHRLRRTGRRLRREEFRWDAVQGLGGRLRRLGRELVDAAKPWPDLHVAVSNAKKEVSALYVRRKVWLGLGA